MIEVLYLGPVPACEDAVQVSETQDYIPEMQQQIRRYIDMLKKRFPDCDKVSIVSKSENHDFGKYMEVVVEYESSFNDRISEVFQDAGYENERKCGTSTLQAFFIENNLPAYWSDTEVLYFYPNELDKTLVDDFFWEHGNG